MRLHSKFTLLLLAAALLGGCAAGPVALDSARLEQLRAGERVNVIYHGPIGPAIQTAEDAVTFQFSMGLAGWGSPGLKIMDENGIDDPLIAIREQLTERLRRDGGLRRLSPGDSPAPYDQLEIDQVRAAHGDGLHLQLIPGQWTIIYYVTDWGRYQMYYGVQGRLVDTRSNTVLWRDGCQVNRADGDAAPTMEELMAERAQLLKDWMADATRQCADQLADKLLGSRA